MTPVFSRKNLKKCGRERPASRATASSSMPWARPSSRRRSDLRTRKSRALRRPRSGPAAGPCPGRVKTGVEKLVQIPMDDPITRCGHKGMGKTRANRAERRSDPDPVGPEAKAAAALLVTVEPTIADISHQKKRGLISGTRLKGMRLPRVDRHAGAFVNQMGNVSDGHDCRRTAELEGQMTFAVGVGAHRLVEPVDSYPAERSMTDRQCGAHVTPPYAQVIVLTD